MGTRFGFGQNWQSFLDELDDDRVRRAQTDLQETFNIEDFAGKSFLDIGCGSGLFSLAAHRLGAQEVFSFDYDANAVDCCRSLHSQEGDTTWEVQRGDLLDDEFMNSLGKYEYVYCWGWPTTLERCGTLSITPRYR